MKFAVVTFPGSNCDYDCYRAVIDGIGCRAEYVWHRRDRLEGFDCVILPGGFSYGDYLRTGAIARFSPIMRRVTEFAERGGPVIGICNGFQILLECGLLPGAMLVNRGLRFVCRTVHLRVENDRLPFTLELKKGQVVRIPVAHKEGNYFADQATMDELRSSGRVVFRYCDAEGRTDGRANPNGSLDDIAGICNSKGNVLGMMPHPERAMEILLGSKDGLALFMSIKKHLEQGCPAA
jgi:phosphoribosylformylglycinamidine synthase